MLTLQVQDHAQEPVFLDRSFPTVGPTEILIRTAACALNFADLLMIRGTYQETPALPFTLGMEVAGHVLAIGSAVTVLKLGIVSQPSQGLAASLRLLRWIPRAAS